MDRSASAEETVRAARRSTTRTLILDTAERLFAEHGVHAVSNRQIGESAGQANTSVVGYYFRSRLDLVRAIVDRHNAEIDGIRTRMLARIGDSPDVRDWVACLVHPMAEHLAAAGGPTWFARFGAQVMTDPSLRGVMIEDAFTSPSVQRIRAGLKRCLPALPPRARSERADIVLHLLVHVWAEREHAVAEGLPTLRATWQDAASGLVDAIVGIWLAPVTAVEEHAVSAPA